MIYHGSQNTVISIPKPSCPLCHSPEAHVLVSLECGTFDTSPLYPSVRLAVCSKCCHVFNLLSAKECQDLSLYYEHEYAPMNTSAKNIGGDRPGSDNGFTRERYITILKMIEPHCTTESSVCDIGCAMGGFLQFIQTHGFSRLHGVEKTTTYVALAQQNTSLDILAGEAERLPFDDASLDIVIMEQVLEHLHTPSRAFQEARRVLRPHGLLFVGVPDASRYAECDYFPFYWLLLREHIQHFDQQHLERMAALAGFQRIDSRTVAHPVMSMSMVMPVVYALFRASENVAETPISTTLLQTQLQNYIDKARSRETVLRKTIRNTRENATPVYCWGIGREFLYLYMSVGLKECRIEGLIDRNLLKLSSTTVDNRELCSSDVLGKAPPHSVLFITAPAHEETIIHAARDLGFRGKIHTLI